MRAITSVTLVGVIGALLLGGGAFAQDDTGIAPVDIVSEGETMFQAVSDSDFEGAYAHAQRILEAVGNELEERSAEEMYWIGMAHMYLMAQSFEAAVQSGLSGERAEFAADMASWVTNPVEDVRVVSHGEQIELTDCLVPGQTVIFDFFSKYCPPCVQLAPYMEELAESRDDVMLVTVDINRPGVRGIDWESPVARQFALRSIPHLKVYGPDGALVAEGDQARAMIIQWLQDLEG